MSEPQLSVRSSQARDLAHDLAKRTGQPINKLVERARCDQELPQKGNCHPIGLNIGDCFFYAVAAVNKAPLLFKGQNLGKTDFKLQPGSSIA